MMRALVALVIVGGCAFEHGDTGPTGDGSEGAGSGAMPSTDSDGDGLLDVVDNCVTVGNADQRDHDDDGHGDACDGCPHLPDTGSDADGDGVADACDPRPTEPGDRLAFFEGFYGDVGWDAVIGANTWQLEQGALRQSQLDAPYQLVRDDTPDLGTVFVDARVRIHAVSTDATSRRSTGLVLGYGDTEHYFFCGLAAGTGQGSEINVGEVSTDFFGSARYEYTPGEFAAPMSGDWLTLQARTSHMGDATRIECVSHRLGVTGTAMFDADADPAGDVGIRTNGTDASFDYVFVVEVP